MANLNFIDFIVAAQDEESLVEGFFKQNDKDQLHEFFNNHNYNVSMEDCEKLIMARKKFGLDELDDAPIPPVY